MFDANPKITKLKEAVRDLFASKERGELVEYGVVEKLIGIQRDETRFRSITDWARRHNESQSGPGITISIEPSVGFLFLSAEQQLNEKLRRDKKGRRQFSRGEKSVAAIIPDHLSDHQRRQQAALIDSAAKERQRLKESAALAAFIMRAKGDAIPIRLRENDDRQETA